jgi:hypothetical protein
MSHVLGRRAALAAVVWSLGACGSSGAGGSAGTSGGAGTTGSAGTTASAGTTGNAGTTGGAGATQVANTCAMFPADDAWNTDVSAAAVDATWTQRVQALVGATTKLHPDFGDTYGIPINAVPASQPALPITFDDYPEESDPGPYPFPPPASVKIEGGTATSCDGDCHVLVVQQGTCMLYEGYGCHYANGWHCANGAKWDLKKNGYGQRPVGWTSADAAGLAIAPGILRHDEAAAGPVKHAIRFTVRCTTNKYVKPATHAAVPTNDVCDPKSPNPAMPPMGLRVRMKADYTLAGASPIVANILAGFKKYGMILADNGSNFYFQGDPNAGWSNDDLDLLKQIPASAFEAVGVPPLQP